MIDEPRAVSEERITNLEAQLSEALERMNSFEAWRRRSTRGWLIGIAVLLVVAVVVSQTVTARASHSGSSPLTVEAPFTVVDTSGRTIAEIDVNGNRYGGVATFYNTFGEPLAQIGISKDHSGQVSVTDADTHHVAMLKANVTGAMVAVTNGSDIAGLLGVGKLTGLSDETAPSLLLENSGKVTAALQVLKGRGNLQLIDSSGNIRVEAGTEDDGNGAVRVSGVSGKCYAGPAILPCMIVGH